MPNWEPFKETGGRGVYDKRVSLSSRGTLTLNQPAFDALGEPDKVELFYDRTERLIGLKASSTDVKYAITVRKQGMNKSYLVNARPFCYYYKIDISQTMRFKDIKMSAEGIMILDLKSVTPVEMKRARTVARASHENLHSSIDA